MFLKHTIGIELVHITDQDLTVLSVLLAAYSLHGGDSKLQMGSMLLETMH